LLALVAAGCGQPVPPPVAAQEVVLAAGDLAVMRALLDDIRGRSGIRRFLVVHTTLAVCDRDPGVFGAPPGGCLGPQAIDGVSKVMPTAGHLTALMNFQTRNARRLPIAEALGADVACISATLVDFMSIGDLQRQHPGSAVVTLSTPSYPAPGASVLSYRMNGEPAAVRLALRPDGRWTVVGRHGGTG
jgi:hypothetical protein